MRWLLLIVGLSAGIAAAFLFNVKSAAQSGMAGGGGNTAVTEILVAASDLAPGKKLVESDLEWVEWPASAVLDGFVEKEAEPDAAKTLASAIVRGGLRKGMPLTTEDLVDESSGYLSAILTPGMRAVALPISAAQTAGGFILPDDRVDVLLARKCPDGVICAKESEVEEILQNVRVLAIDQAGTVAADGTAIVGETATLELSPEDARILVAAQTVGTPTLILRSAGDFSKSPALPQAAPATEVTEAETPAPLPMPVLRSVRVIRNGQAQSYDVN